MSAIWGIISRNGTNQTSRFERMSNAMQVYKIDRFDTLGNDACSMGCGHQYFTNEAVFDCSPVYSKDDNDFFAADCFLYNRDDVYALLSDEGRSLQEIGDADLSYLLYKKVGLSFVEKLRGSFAFAIYKCNTGELHLITEHFCKRYLAYHIDSDYISFASCYKPILEAGDHQFKLSKRAIVGAYSTMSPLNFRESEITIFENVFHLDASKHYTIDVKSGHVKKEQYWTPRKDVPKRKGLKDEDYRKLFLDTYQDVCTAHLRSRKETGIMLSGGLDSASVLALTAPVLRDAGKKIYSYTSVPCNDFKPVIDYSKIEDETFLIHEQQKLHPNLEPRFIDCDGMDCIRTLAKHQETYDIPIKAVVNFNNIYYMGERAMADDCLLLLSGSNGNASVSYGYASTFVGLCVSRFRFPAAVKEVNAYCKRTGFSRKEMLKLYLKDVYGYFFKTKNIGQYFVSKENREAYHVSNIMRHEKRELGSSFVTSERKKRNYMYIPKQYIQKSFYYTMNSLTQGILNVDPTLTVEIVELCMSLPDACFVQDGVERRLIRDYMKELLPPWITDMRKGHGIQSPDFNYRINRDWDALKEDVFDLLNDPLLFEYLDRKEVQKLLDQVKKEAYHLSWNNAWYVANICSLGYFLRGHARYLE